MSRRMIVLMVVFLVLVGLAAAAILGLPEPWSGIALAVVVGSAATLGILYFVLVWTRDFSQHSAPPARDHEPPAN